MIKYSTLLEEEKPEGYNSPMAIIKLDEGDFKGTLFHYGSVAFPPEEELEENEDVNMTFEFNVVKPCEGYDIDGLESDKEFQRTVGDLLVEILETEFSKIDE